MASANFYNDSAVMRGIDFHHAQIVTGPMDLIKPKGTTQEDWPYYVQVSASSSGGDDSKRTPKLTADGLKMIRDGFTVGNVPHVPAPGPFHPSQAAEWAQIIGDSKTTPLLKMATVTSAGDPLSVCAVAALGFNLNCQDGGMKLTGIVKCVCSVQTTPQAKDLLFRIFDDFFKKMLIKWLTKLFDTLLTLRKVPWPVRPVLVWVFKQVVAKAVDWMEQLLKWLWDEAQKNANEPPKQDPALPQPDPPPEDPEAVKKWIEEDRKRQEEREIKELNEKLKRKQNPWSPW
jgi:hypothetical protein